jgi:CubicO group peptidase (beta-lactamase class C family)
MTLEQRHWQDRLTVLAEKHDVVGTTLAIGFGDETAVAAAGVLNRRTEQPATPDSLFQIGSITKVWTATIAMQLVDEGRLDLDAPVVTYLPAFRIADDDTTQRVTTRHLLTHMSGIAGDFFPDTGRGDDCLERFVALMVDLPASHPLGVTMSYCNAGFVLLGRLIEVLVDTTWDNAVRQRLLAPLGLEAAGTLPEEALLWGAATGHLTPPGTDGAMVAPQWSLSRNAGPAGLIHARARDLVAFARLHLADGVAPDGTRLLSAEAARAMREPQVAMPEQLTLGGSIGLSWILSDWGGHRIFGHDGGTIGQSAYLRVLPGDATRPDLTVALVTNGGQMKDLHLDLFGEVFDELAGVTMPPRVEPPAVPPHVDPDRYVGHYWRESMDIEVVARGEGLVLVNRPTGVLATAMGASVVESPLLPYADDVFLASLPTVSGYLGAVFYEIADGTRYLHFGGRAAAKID